MSQQWAPEEVETAAWCVGPHSAAASTLNPRIRVARDMLAKMPACCQRCGRGRPVCVLAGDGKATAVCAACRAADDPDRERLRLLAAARADQARLNAACAQNARNQRLLGYVAVFGQPYRRADGTDEVVVRGAFQDALCRRRVVLRVNHDPQRIIARQDDGTLRLREDAHGL